MKKISFSSFINIIICMYILSIYIFTYRDGLNIISNALAFILISAICINLLITKRKFVINKLLIIYFLFISICVISVLFALNQSVAIIKVITLILIFLVMFSFINYIDSFEKLRKVMTYFIYSGFISSIYILINSDFSQISRYGNELGNQNTVGLIIGISSVFCFYIILNEKKYWYILLLIFMIATIFLTGSRLAILFILINILLILYFTNKKNIKNIFKGIVISVLILLIISYLVFNVQLFYQIIGVRIENLISFLHGENINESSINLRAYMTRFGLEMFKKKPIMGYGIDNYRILYGNNTSVETYSHNNFIELMIGTGVFGVTIYYLMQIVVIKDLFRYLKKISNTTVCYIFISIIISYIILSPISIYYYSKQFYILLAMSSVIISFDKLVK